MVNRASQCIVWLKEHLLYPKKQKHVPQAHIQGPGNRTQCSMLDLGVPTLDHKTVTSTTQVKNAVHY